LLFAQRGGVGIYVLSTSELPRLKRGGAGIYACGKTAEEIGFSRCGKLVRHFNSGNALILLPQGSNRS
jgi:hypothetical protein